MKSFYQSPYEGGSLTRRAFLFREMRITAKLLSTGMKDKDAYDYLRKENLFQYPTERSIGSMATTCIKRLRNLDSAEMIDIVGNQSIDTAKQVCLYAMIKQSKLAWDFMVSVIGEKYRIQDLTFSKKDLNNFFAKLQEQDDLVASWSESSIEKNKSVLKKTLVDVNYLDSLNSTILNNIILDTRLKRVIKMNRDEAALIAFNCFA